MVVDLAESAVRLCRGSCLRPRLVISTLENRVLCGIFVITFAFYQEHWVQPEGGWEHVRALVYSRLTLDR